MVQCEHHLPKLQEVQASIVDWPTATVGKLAVATANRRWVREGLLVRVGHVEGDNGECAAA